MMLKLLKSANQLRSLTVNPQSELVPVFVALFYGTCSVSMNFLNKGIVSSYQFNYPFFIMAIQMILTITILDLLRVSGLVANLQAYTLKEGLEFFPASFFFALHSTLSLYALHGMNIPMYGAIKRCTPLVNLVLAVLILKHSHPSPLLSSSVLLITAGCIIASLGDLEFDANAYLMGFLSVFAQAAYLTLIQKSSEQKHRSTFQMLLMNGYNTLPIFLVVSLLVGEPADIGQSTAVNEPGFLPLFSLLAFCGCVLTFAQFLCASVCSALTTSMVSVGKSVIQTVVGFFTFGGVKFHPLNIVGLCLNVFGGFLYTYVKHMEKRLKKDQINGKDDKPKMENLSVIEPNGYRKKSTGSSTIHYVDEDKYRTV